LLKPSFFAPLIAFFAVGVLMFVKDEKKRNISKIAIGFAVLMFGMQAMSNSVVSLADSPEFCELFIRFKNPFLGMIVGAILTAVIQSSSSSSDFPSWLSKRTTLKTAANYLDLKKVRNSASRSRLDTPTRKKLHIKRILT
jgi:hypothetical protein